MTKAVYYPAQVRELGNPNFTLTKEEANARRRRAVELVQRVYHALDGDGLARYGYATPGDMWEDVKRRAEAVLAENSRLAAAKVRMGRLVADEMINVREVAFMLGMSLAGLRKRLQTGHDHPPYVRYGTGPQARYVFNKAAVRKWLKSQEIKAKIGRPKGSGKKRRKKGPSDRVAPVLEHQGHRPSPLQGPHLWPAGGRKDDPGPDGEAPWPHADPVG